MPNRTPARPDSETPDLSDAEERLRAMLPAAGVELLGDLLDSHDERAMHLRSHLDTMAGSMIAAILTFAPHALDHDDVRAASGHVERVERAFTLGYHAGRYDGDWHVEHDLSTGTAEATTVLERDPALRDAIGLGR